MCVAYDIKYRQEKCSRERTDYLRGAQARIDSVPYTDQSPVSWQEGWMDMDIHLGSHPDFSYRTLLAS